MKERKLKEDKSGRGEQKRASFFFNGRGRDRLRPTIQEFVTVQKFSEDNFVLRFQTISLTVCNTLFSCTSRKPLSSQNFSLFNCTPPILTCFSFPQLLTGVFCNYLNNLETIILRKIFLLVLGPSFTFQFLP